MNVTYKLYDITSYFKESLYIASSLKCKPSKDQNERIENILLHLGLSEARNTKAIQLSGGQRKRLAIAQELINNPPLMFFDEPTSGLDSQVCMGGTTLDCKHWLWVETH